MAGELIIRALEQGDRDQWLRLWANYNAFYERSGPTALPDEITQTTWARLFDPLEPVFGLIARLGDEMVGLAHFLYHRSTTQIGPTCYLQDLFTSEGSRGRGVGRALIDSVCGHAKAAGAPKVYWQTHFSNDTAIALYERVAVRSEFLIYAKKL